MLNLEKHFTAFSPDTLPKLDESPFTDAPIEGHKLPETPETVGEKQEGPPPVPQEMRRKPEEMLAQAARRQQEREQSLGALAAEYYRQMVTASNGGYGDKSYEMYLRAKELYESTQIELLEQRRAA